MTQEEREALFQEIKNRIEHPEKSDTKKKKKSSKKVKKGEAKEEQVEVLSLDELNK